MYAWLGFPIQNLSAPVDKFVRVVVIKEIKGSQYGVQLESAVRDRLAADDKYEEEEEEALEQIVEFLQSKYCKKDSVLTFYFPASSASVEVIWLFRKPCGYWVYSEHLKS